MKPYRTIWLQDFETAERWAYHIGTTRVQHRSGWWDRVSGDALAWADLPAPFAAAQYFAADIEVISLRPWPDPYVTFISVGLDQAWVGFSIRAKPDGSWSLSTWSNLQTVEFSQADPRGAVHRFEAAWDAGVWRNYWDGELIRSAPSPVAHPEQVTVDMDCRYPYPDSDCRLDNILVAAFLDCGSALAADGNSVTRLVTRPDAQGTPRTYGATAFGPPLFGSEVVVEGVLPAVAILRDGSRVHATQTSSGVRVWRTSAIASLGLGTTMTLTGHSRPALCSLGERGQVLLVTYRGGVLYLTRGSVSPSGFQMDVAGSRVVASGNVAEATPAIAALADSEMVLCYQDFTGSVIQRVSADGGQTWS